jgi:hypothetical protein
LVVAAGTVEAELSPAARNTRFPPATLVTCVPDLTRNPGRLAGAVDFSSRYHEWTVYRLLGPGHAEEWWAVKPAALGEPADARRFDQDGIEFVLQDLLS